MLLNLNDAASIRSWVAVHPERHTQLLRAMWRMWPQFRAAIEEAMQGMERAV